MKFLAPLLLLLLAGCNRPAALPTRDVAHSDVPNEAFTACAGKKVNDACVVTVNDVEALGACATATRFSDDRRLFCNGAAH